MFRYEQSNRKLHIQFNVYYFGTAEGQINNTIAYIQDQSIIDALYRISISGLVIGSWDVIRIPISHIDSVIGELSISLVGSERGTVYFRTPNNQKPGGYYFYGGTTVVF